MPIERSDPVIINRIRRAGLGKVRLRAQADGRTPERVARDVGILRDVANGSIPQAAAKAKCSRRHVEDVLTKYGAYALEILEEST